MKLLQNLTDIRIQLSQFQRCVSALCLVSLCASCSSSTSASSPISEVTTVEIVSSFPLTGSSQSNSQSIVNGIQQALDETNSSVCNGKVKIKYTSMDDATASAGKWDPETEIANADKAVANPAVVAYLGPYNSGAAKLSIPITNRASLVQVSPATSYPGLTKSGKGEANEPNAYYPTSKRSFARVFPADDIGGVMGAKWAKSLGATRIFILDDQDLYGKGVANVFDVTARKIGMKVLGHEGIDTKAPDYRALMTKIKALQPDLIYFGGNTQSNVGQLIKDTRSVGITNSKTKFMGSDAIMEQALLDVAGTDAEGIYIPFAGVPPGELTGAGKTWYENYKTKYKVEPEVYAVYGYEAGKVVINAIGKVCRNDRAAILNAVMNTKDYHGVLGTWSFDANGDTTLSTMSANMVKGGKFKFLHLLNFN